MTVQKSEDFLPGFVDFIAIGNLYFAVQSYLGVLVEEHFYFFEEPYGLGNVFV